MRRMIIGSKITEIMRPTITLQKISQFRKSGFSIPKIKFEEFKRSAAAIHWNSAGESHQSNRCPFTSSTNYSIMDKNMLPINQSSSSAPESSTSTT